MGVILAFGSAVLYSCSQFLSKLSVDKTKSPIAVSVVFQLLSGIACMFFFLFEKPEMFKSDPTVWGLFALTIFMYGIFSILGIKSSKMLQISVNTILGQITLVIIFISSLFIFSEAATWQKFTGVALIIGGNALVVGAMHASKKVGLEGVLLKLGASVALAVAMLIDAVNNSNFSAALYVSIVYLASGFATWIFGRVSLAEITSEFKANWKWQVIMAVFAAVGYYMLIKAFAIAPKSIVLPVNNLNGTMLVMFGVIFLRETDHLKRKIFAAVLALAGAVLLSI